MDPLAEYLDELASLGSSQGQGAFTLAPDKVWERLRQSLPDGEGSLRFLLRWLHQRGAVEIAVKADKASLALWIQARFADPESLPGPAKALDISGADIELARAVVGSEMLEVPLVTEVDDGASRWVHTFRPGAPWEAVPSDGQTGLRASYALTRPGWPLVELWRQDVSRRFRCSPLPLTWDGESLTSSYSFPYPVLIWRHLRRWDQVGAPWVIPAPPTALESFRAARHLEVDVALGMTAGRATGSLRDSASPLFVRATPSPEEPFALLREGELLPLPAATRELAGFCGVIRSDHHPLDLQGELPVWNKALENVVATFKDEAVDMALQLYRREPPLDSEQAAAVFLGIQSVLLHLLDHQRFVEGHTLATWLRETMGSHPILEDFRQGYTFDKLSALLAEPARQPQTALRWNKQAEARVRARSVKEPELADEALLIEARLELRARRNLPTRLAGATQGRLMQLAGKEERRGRYSQAASIYHMLGHALPVGEERDEQLTQAQRCGLLAGETRYDGLLARDAEG